MKLLTQLNGSPGSLNSISTGLNFWKIHFFLEDCSIESKFVDREIKATDYENCVLKTSKNYKNQKVMNFRSSISGPRKRVHSLF